MDRTVAMTAASEFVMPCMVKNPDDPTDTGLAVAFFTRGVEQLFYIPVPDEKTATELSGRLRDLFVEAMGRYEDLRAVMKT